MTLFKVVFEWANRSIILSGSYSSTHKVTVKSITLSELFSTIYSHVIVRVELEP